MSSFKMTTYKILKDVEHAFKRPDMYMGENKVKTKEMFLYSLQDHSVYTNKISFSTGLLKIFDEILTNAIDNYHRKPKMTTLKVNITDKYISIFNDGHSIEISKFDPNDPDSKYNPEVLFTVLRSGSNFDDDEERIIGGRNGIGCKITTIFSTRFEIDIVNNNLRYTQTVTKNDTQIQEPVISKTKDSDYVKITFYPDFSHLHITTIDDNTKALLYKRVHDLSYIPIKIFINNVQLPHISWNEFVESYGLSNFVTYQTQGKFAWNVSFSISDKNKEISYVNNIRTYNGGEHVKYIRNQIISRILKIATKSAGITPQIIKSKFNLVMSSTIVNPEFDSQAKEKLTSQEANFGCKCKIPIKLIDDYISSNHVIDLLSNKLISQENTKLKRSNIKKVEKLVEANKAGTKEGYKCTLFICEGLSAKTMVDSGICILGHDYYGCYPLRGKVLNSRNASPVQYHKNRELNDLKLIIGLEDGKEYTTTEGLRYGKIVCVKDADSDGADIMGLVINFFDNKFPSLLRIEGFFSEFISPMIQVIFKSGNKVTKVPFYNEVEYNRYKDKNDLYSNRQVTVKFIKGLATNEDDDIKNYFHNYEDNCINIEFPDDTEEYIDKAFNGKRADDRKNWLTTITPDTHLPRDKGKPISCIDFIENDLVLYSMDSCIRSIPSAIDGLKPSQRKIIYTLFNLGEGAKRMMKVFQLCGLVAKNSNYHHGDQSMNATIINMGQDFPGSNNIPLLKRSGQFGSRMENGADAGQPRYIFCSLNEITRLLFPKCDDELLDYKEEDNQKVEPIYYIPIIPMVLINGCLGIGTGWSTMIPAFNPLDVIDYVKKMINCEKLPEIRSYYKGYEGVIEETKNGWNYYGSFESSKTRKVIVREIPIDMSISGFQELLNELSDKDVEHKVKIGNKIVRLEGSVVEKYVNKNNKDANSVWYEITFNKKYTDDEIESILKLKSSKSNKNMVLFDSNGMITRFETIYSIIDEWFGIRYELYDKRIKRIIENLEFEFMRISNKARFIKENVEETINIKNVPINDVERMLEKRKYDRIDGKYDYLVDMKIRYMTKEKYDELKKEMERVKGEIDYMKNTSVEVEWLKDVKVLEDYIKKNKMFE